ncbi:MAG: hypothetical protein H7263_13140 [Candidatus Sericytochromatia bacterium]|nr:hypothetical protein [Candidatus Sericytochromatia bacterium]
MSELTNSSANNINNSETEAKMKRMAIAVKAVGGWFSYFFGMATLAFGTINIYEWFKYIDIFITGIGFIIVIFGLYLLFAHVKAKKNSGMNGKTMIVKLVKYAGGIIFIPGILSLINLPIKSNLHLTSLITAIIGAIFLILSFILKKMWGIKSEKRKKTPIIIE